MRFISARIIFGSIEEKWKHTWNSRTTWARIYPVRNTGSCKLPNKQKTFQHFYQTSIENTNWKKMNHLHGGLISHSRLSFSSDLSKQFSFPSHTLFRSMHSPLSHVNSVRASQHLASLLSSDLSEQSTWPSQRYSRGMHCSSLWQVNWYSLHS